MSILNRTSHGRRAAVGRSSKRLPIRQGRSVRALLALMILMPQLSGCYSFVPVGGSPPPLGAEVAVRPTDRGRLALSEAVGPGLIRIGGNLLETTDTAVVLGVTSVQLIDLGGPLRWNGERVVISRDLIAEFREKRLSRPRSALFGAVLAVGAVAVSMIAIKGFGSDSGGDKPDNGEPPQSSLIPLFKR